MLGSINLSAYVSYVGRDPIFDFSEFSKDVRTAVVALNSVLKEGLPLHPLQEQRDSVRKWRQIGLGIFGLGDMLIKMEIDYGSPRSITLCRSIASTMINAALQQSALIARDCGTYEEYSWDKVSSTPFFKAVANSDTVELVRNYGLYNSQLLTTAPTGSISTMLNVSGGIEPLFATHYTRTTKTLHEEDYTYDVYPAVVQDYMEDHGLTDDSQLPDYFKTAHNVDYRERIAMQAAWQNFIDASISSTINVPHEFTVEQIEELYMTAWENGLKGVTVFRDGCDRAAILNTGDKKESEPASTKESVSLGRGDVILPSDDLISFKKTIHTGCGKMYIHCDFDEATGEPLETYIDIGSGGGCERNLQFISRLMSLALRSGVPIETIIDQAHSIRPCNAFMKKDGTSKGTSCASAIGYALAEINERIQNTLGISSADEDEEAVEIEQDVHSDKNKCPECGSHLVFESGCVVCKICGWSKCG